MAQALHTVRQFLEATNTRKDVSAAVQLMDDAIRFTGPAIQTQGVQEYVGLLERFLASHVDWKLHSQFENGDEACVMTEIEIQPPAGGDTVRLELAEWFRVEAGKIKEHRVYYDPRAFMAAFGMEN